MNKKLIAFSIVAVIVAALVASAYSTDINGWYMNTFPSAASVPGGAAGNFADRDIFCVAAPDTHADVVVVIKKGEPFIFTGNTQGAYKEVESPRYQPTCWVIIP